MTVVALENRFFRLDARLTLSDLLIDVLAVAGGTCLNRDVGVLHRFQVGALGNPNVAACAVTARMVLELMVEFYRVTLNTLCFRERRCQPVAAGAIGSDWLLVLIMTGETRDMRLRTGLKEFGFCGKIVFYRIGQRLSGLQKISGGNIRHLRKGLVARGTVVKLRFCIIRQREPGLYEMTDCDVARPEVPGNNILVLVVREYYRKLAWPRRHRKREPGGPSRPRIHVASRAEYRPISGEDIALMTTEA